MARSMIKWVAAGALISIGVVGVLTGLVLLPFGIILAGSAAGGHELSWPVFVIGLVIGPVALLADDMGDSVPASGGDPAFWVGVAHIVLGTLLSAHALRSRPA